jgi:hypothetical protein
MWPLVIGMVSAVTTVVIRSQVMNAITVKTANVTIAASARHIVKFATPQFAWDAAMNARIATSLFAVIVPLFVKNAMRRFARIVLMNKDYVKIVKNKERKTKMKNIRKNQQNQRPVLRFSPTAWAKLQFCRDMTDNEVGGFGITEADDLMFVTDFVLVKQKVTAVSVSFEDESVADFFEDQVETGRQPEQFARLWIHCHPGNSPEPSMTDESTFTRVFGSCDWAIMFIVAQDGKTFARLRFNAGPGGEVKIPVSVDYGYEFDAADFALWKQQYLAKVVEDSVLSLAGKSKKKSQDEESDIFGCENSSGLDSFSDHDLLSEIDSMDPMERQYFMEELAIRSDFWDEYESEVLYE